MIIPASAQLLSDTTGLVFRFDVEIGGSIFEIETISNFDVLDYEFDKDEKRLTLFINSSLENNLSELSIPKPLLSGDFTFYLNDEQFSPTIKSNERISFITLNFSGIGKNKIDVIGTESFNGLDKIPITKLTPMSEDGGGCLIATAAYGSELAPQVQQLRELRDNFLLQTQSGTIFMSAFNDFYYSFSPVVADYQRENLLFKEIVKLGITPMISSLSILNYVDMDSEYTVLGYGASLIALNIGMYVGVPASVILLAKRKL